MAVIYFVRHGQTDWNARDLIQGQAEVPLNERGRAEAHRNAEALARRIGDGAAFDYVASPMGRARETMEIIRTTLGLPTDGYRLDDRLIEVDYGDWQGASWPQLRVVNADEIAARFADPWRVSPPNGESYAEATERLLPWLNEVAGDTVVVSHGGVARCLRGHILDLPFEERPRFDVPHDKVMQIDGGKIAWF